MNPQKSSKSAEKKTTVVQRRLDVSSMAYPNIGSTLSNHNLAIVGILILRKPAL
jgi:hypothetical protein